VAVIPVDPQQWQQFGAFWVVRPLGQGGMGQVYLAVAPNTDVVTIKILREELRHDAEARRRFAQEVRVAHHVGENVRHTPRVIDARTDGDAPWMVSEYIAAPSLATAVQSGAKFDENGARALLAGITEALGMIHECGVLHRDITPANILLAPNGPRIIDFGIAKPIHARGHTTDGVIGTKPYLAPERVNSAPADEATEVWSAAAVVHYALTGTAPREARRNALRPLSPGFRDLLNSCLSKRPDRRPYLRKVLRWATDGRSASALVYDHWMPSAALFQVHQLKDEVAVIERLARTGPESGRRRGSVRRLVAGAVIVVALAGGTWLAYDQGYLGKREAADQPAPAASAPAGTCERRVRPGKGLNQLPYRCEVTYVNGTIPVFRSPDSAPGSWAWLKESSGEQWFACHVRGAAFTAQGRTSTWWARTQSDSNKDRWGYVPEAYLPKITDNPVAMAVCD
jgi:hypothetical protein